MKRVVEFRRRLREEAIRRAGAFAKCVESKLGKVTAIVFGSYARGDFNAWSDIDVLIVTNTALPTNPLRRLDMVEECLLNAGAVEPIILTEKEFLERLRRRDPAVVEAVEKGITLLDSLGLKKLVEGFSQTT